jgi:hypothetical protein
MGSQSPSLDLFMTGYKNLLKMDILSKTLENSYLIMKRQVWTNEKSSLSGVGGGPGGEHLEDTCKLCRDRENTMHLMFECEKYSKPLWAVVGDALKETVNRESKGKENLSNRLHAFLVLYNVTAGLPSKYIKKHNDPNTRDKKEYSFA